jgi:hypothetical protein
VHLDVLRLADAEGAVHGLVLDRRVPPAVEEEHVVGGRQVQAGAARLERQDEDEPVVLARLETLDHPIPLRLGDRVVLRVCRPRAAIRPRGETRGRKQRRGG